MWMKYVTVIVLVMQEKDERRIIIGQGRQENEDDSNMHINQFKISFQ